MSKPLRWNIDQAILATLPALAVEINGLWAHEPGEPRIEIAQDLPRLQQAAHLMAQAFVQNQDKGWLAWLRPRDVARIRAGDFEAAERHIGRIILYLLRAATFNGGITILESACGPDGVREIRGAAVCELPTQAPPSEGLLHKYGLGTLCALRSYGLQRAIAANLAYLSLRRATDQMQRDMGIPTRCLRSGIMCVHPRFEGKRVASRLWAPAHVIAERHRLHILMESSNPDRNDDRVFKRFGLQHVGEHVYGASRFNGVGPYVIKLMVRPPPAA